VKVFWREYRAGQKLILDTGTEELEVGAFRRTPRGYDAFAKTLGYEPGRAQKGFQTSVDAKAFVESFEPWDLYIGSADIEFDHDVHELLGDPT
jgi:hypothetical protein